MSYRSPYSTDVELVRAVLAQEALAEDAFIDLVWKVVNAHAHACNIPPSRAEEMASAVVVKSLYRLHRFKIQRASLRVWMFAIAGLHACDMLGKVKNDPLRLKFRELQSWMEVSNDRAATDEETMSSPAEILERLKEALKQLTPAERALLESSPGEDA